MRRSRIAVRPNVKPGGRGPASSQGSGDASQDGVISAPMTPKGAAGSDVPQHFGGQSVQVENNASVGPESTNGSQPEKKASPNLDGKEQNDGLVGNRNLALSSWQRRKRFFAMPNLSKTRVTPVLVHTPGRTPRSLAAKTTVVPTVEKMAMSAEDQPQLRSPGRKRTYSGEKQARPQGRAGPLSPVAQEPSASAQAKRPKAKPLSRLSRQLSEDRKASKDVIPRDGKSLPSEPVVAGVKSSQGFGCSVKPLPCPSALAPRTQSSSLDRDKILKAQKLRELLKRDWKTKKKRRKAKYLNSEQGIQQDHNKMTMGDLIYYLPETNPMKSYMTEESTVVEKLASPAPAQMLTNEPQETEEEEEEEEEEDVENRNEEQNEQDEEDDEQLVAPRVKVAEDGSLIIDEESLTVEVLRAKGPNAAEENDPIFERGSSTTYSSFRKGHYTKPWSKRETDMFFLAISMVGTDFSMIGQLFPHRGRSEIKNKFKREERTNSWRIDKAFEEKRRFDQKSFRSLLEEILTEEEKKQQKSKVKGSEEKTKPRRSRNKRKPAKKVSTKHSAEEVSGADVDGEAAEKENEDCSNIGESREEATPLQRKEVKKIAEKEHPSPGKAAEGRRPRSRAGEAEDAAVCDSGDVVSEGPPSDSLVQSVGSPAAGGREPVVKPAQLLRRHIAKPPTGSLGRKVPEIKEKATAVKSTCEEDKGGGGTEPGGDSGALAAGKPKKGKRVGTDVASSEGEEQSSDVESEADVVVVQEQMLNRPTRSGRVPKLSQALQEAGQEDPQEEPIPTSSLSPSPSPSGATQSQRRQPPGPGRRPKSNLSTSRRSRMVTLRASLPEDAERQEAGPEDLYNYVCPEEQNQAPAFVPLSLRSPEPVRLEVEETVEEFEISDHAADAFSPAEPESALCPPGQFQQVPAEDLLVDVVEFLPPDHVEELSASDESYNEAARTLLTIRNPELLSPESVLEESPPQAVDGGAGLGSKVTSKRAEEARLHLDPSPAVTSDLPSNSCPRVERRSTETVLPESPPAGTSAANPCPEKRVADRAGGTCNITAEPELMSDGPQARRRRFAKPKPNLAHAAQAPVAQQMQSTMATGSDSADAHAAPPQSVGGSDGPEVVAKAMALEESEASAHPKQSVSISQKGNRASEASLQAGPQGRRSRFSKPRPNLGRAVRNPHSTAAQRPPGQVTAEGGSPAETNPTDETRTNVKARVPATEPQMEEADRAPRSVPAGDRDGGREDSPGSPADGCTTQPEDDPTSAAVTHSTTEVSANFTQTEPTIILTLFEVPPPPVSEYELESSSVPVGTVTAELISPLVFIDTPSESKGVSPLGAADELQTGCSGLSHFMDSEALAPVLHEQEGDMGASSVGQDHACPTPLSEREVRKLDKSCDENVSLTLVPVEEPCGVQEETREDSTPPLKRRRMITKRGGMPNLKPSPFKKAPVQSTEDDHKESAPPVPAQAVSEQVPSKVPSTSTMANPMLAQAMPEIGDCDPPKQNVDGLLRAEETNGHTEQDPQQSPITPLTMNRPLSRPGRKPKGFLSFISNKSSAGPVAGSAAAPRTTRAGPHRPLVNTFRMDRRRPPPVTGVSTKMPDTSTDCSNPRPAASQTLTLECSQVPDQQDEELPGVKPSDVEAKRTEPSDVSKYFFSDIFTEVEEMV